MEREACNKTGPDPLMDEFVGISGGWAIDEVMIIGFVSQYHLWEKQVFELLEKQLGKNGKSIRNFKRNKKSVVTYVREILESEFSAIVPDELWAAVDECRKVVNTWKHGLEANHSRLFEEYPTYYPSCTKGDGEREIRNAFVVSKVDFARATDALSNFWEHLPHKVNYQTGA